MEQKTIRPIPIIITVVALVALGAILINANRHPALAPTTAQTSQGQSLCYVLNKPTASGHNDIAYLKLTTPDGGAHATGELYTALAEKDSMRGMLSGTVTVSTDGAGAIFDGTYANSGEGMNNIDERMIRLSNDKAEIGYGETVQNADGSYSYKDKSAVTYSLSIPNVDCAQYDTLKTASN